MNSIVMILIIIGCLAMFSYGIYCIINGGYHDRYHGWRTKEDAPKSYYFTVIIMIFMSVSIVVNFIFFQR